MGSKPRIIVLSKDIDTTFAWESVGWYRTHVRGTNKAKALMVKAKAAIDAGTDVKDSIRRLQEAGFEIERQAELEFDTMANWDLSPLDWDNPQEG